LLVAYEIFEISLGGITFKTEKVIDIIWDILFAIIGCIIAYYIGR
jgi:hypothetical protein